MINIFATLVVQRFQFVRESNIVDHTDIAAVQIRLEVVRDGHFQVVKLILMSQTHNVKQNMFLKCIKRLYLYNYEYNPQSYTVLFTSINLMNSPTAGIGPIPLCQLTPLFLCTYISKDDETRSHWFLLTPLLSQKIPSCRQITRLCKNIPSNESLLRQQIFQECIRYVLQTMKQTWNILIELQVSVYVQWIAFVPLESQHHCTRSAGTVSQCFGIDLSHG